MSYKNVTNDNITFVEALVAVVIAAVLVHLWIRVINNFAYQTLKLNQNSTFWALVIALIISGLLVIYVVFVLDEETSKQIKQRVTGVSYVTPLISSSIAVV